MLDVVRKAADRIGGVPRLAERIGVTRQAIYQWREVPVDRIVDIAAATGVSRTELRPDIFAVADDLSGWRRDTAENILIEPDFAGLRRDFLAWTEAQCSAVETRSVAEIDRDHLVALLRSLVSDARLDIERRLAVIIVRLLKWRYQPTSRSLSTIGVINTQRARVLARFAASASLKAHATAELDRIFKTAVAQACDETRLSPGDFPSVCPFSIDELLDPAFAPPANVD